MLEMGRNSEQCQEASERLRRLTALDGSEETALDLWALLVALAQHLVGPPILLLLWGTHNGRRQARARSFVTYGWHEEAGAPLRLRLLRMVYIGTFWVAPTVCWGALALSWRGGVFAGLWKEAVLACCYLVAHSVLVALKHASLTSAETDRLLRAPAAEGMCMAHDLQLTTQLGEPTQAAVLAQLEMCAAAAGVDLADTWLVVRRAPATESGSPTGEGDSPGTPRTGSLSPHDALTDFVSSAGGWEEAAILYGGGSTSRPLLALPSETDGDGETDGAMSEAVSVQYVPPPVVVKEAQKPTGLRSALSRSRRRRVPPAPEAPEAPTLAGSGDEGGPSLPGTVTLPDAPQKTPLSSDDEGHHVAGVVHWVEVCSTPELGPGSVALGLPASDTASEKRAPSLRMRTRGRQQHVRSSWGCGDGRMPACGGLLAVAILRRAYTVSRKAATAGSSMLAMVAGAVALLPFGHPGSAGASAALGMRCALACMRAGGFLLISRVCLATVLDLGRRACVMGDLSQLARVRPDPADARLSTRSSPRRMRGRPHLTRLAATRVWPEVADKGTSLPLLDMHERFTVHGWLAVRLALASHGMRTTQRGQSYLAFLAASGCGLLTWALWDPITSTGPPDWVGLEVVVLVFMLAAALLGCCAAGAAVNGASEEHRILLLQHRLLLRSHPEGRLRFNKEACQEADDMLYLCSQLTVAAPCIRVCGFSASSDLLKGAASGLLTAVALMASMVYKYRSHLEQAL